MWTIYEKKTATKALDRCPDEVLVRYEAWKRIIEMSGPQGLRAIKGFHDESLQGDWAGFRSSRLGIKWRVIYFVKNQVLEVYVVDINPHKY